MVNFANGKIYCIRSDSTENVYIGSTTQKLSRRMVQHRSDYKTNRGKSSSEMIKHGDAYIELLEAYRCNNREELCKREGEVMRATPNTVNRNIAGRTKKQYRDEHKEQINIKNKQYMGEHKVEKKQYDEKYRQENKTKIKQHKGKIIRCECGANTTRGHLLRHKRSNNHKSEMEILELANEL